MMAPKHRTPKIPNLRLIEARLSLNLTQDELAALAKVHRYTIIKLETNRMTGAYHSTLEALAAALGKTVDDLFPTP